MSKIKGAFPKRRLFLRMGGGVWQKFQTVYKNNLRKTPKNNQISLLNCVRMYTHEVLDFRKMSFRMILTKWNVDFLYLILHLTRQINRWCNCKSLHCKHNRRQALQTQKKYFTLPTFYFFWWKCKEHYMLGQFKILQT